MATSMLLNLTAIYGLRAMAVLSGLAAGESINAAELSDRTGVPQQYLSKVMRKLVVAELVHAQRGRGGGFRLQRAARQVCVADVLDALAIDVRGRCAFGYAACDATRPCPLHPIWSQLNTDLARWGRETTLAQVDRSPPPAR